MKDIVLMIVDSRRESDSQASAIDGLNSIATIPFQRDSARAFASSHDIAIGAEIVVELDSNFELSSKAEEITDKLNEFGTKNLVVTNLSLFNESGLASKLIPQLPETRIIPV